MSQPERKMLRKTGMKKFLDWLFNRERRYFVSYLWTGEGGHHAYSWSVYINRGLVCDFADMEEIADYIKSRNPGCTTVVILSLQALPA